MQLVAVALEEVRVLEAEGQLEAGVEQAVAREGQLVGAQSALARLHLDCDRDGSRFGAQRTQHRQPRQGQRAQSESKILASISTRLSQQRHCRIYIAIYRHYIF